MDSQRFDHLTRVFGSRRTIVGGSLASLLAALTGWEKAEAQQRACRPSQKRCGKRCVPKRACCPRTQRRCGRRCIPKRACCPGTEKPCNGRCIPASATCCQAAEQVCGTRCISAAAACCSENEKVCGTGCIPLTACCTDEDCGPRRLCADGTCVVGQGTCEVGADFCTDSSDTCGPPGSSCFCRQSTAGQTRCANDALLSLCGECLSDADCVRDNPEVPGAFCAIGRPGCGCTSVTTVCVSPCSAG